MTGIDGRCGGECVLYGECATLQCMCYQAVVVVDVAQLVWQRFVQRGDRIGAAALVRLVRAGVGNQKVRTDRLVVQIPL